jgi:uncharacterized protein
MDPLHVLLLLGAGIAGGFLAGLVGVGGGVIFAPVLFFYYTAIGTEAALVAPLTLGSSLFCTLLAAASGAHSQLRSDNIQLRIAGVVGAFAAAAVVAMTFLVTTRPWYGPQVFQIVLGVVLLAVIWRMLTRRSKPQGPDWRERTRLSIGGLAASGVAAGAIASAAGVGGGIVMVPMFNELLKLPLKIAAATSMATIVLISATGVVAYVVSGLGVQTPATALGYVDFGRAVWLAVPAIIGARLGVYVALRADVAVIRYAFSALAAVIAVRLIGGATGLL